MISEIKSWRPINSALLNPYRNSAVARVGFVRLAYLLLLFIIGPSQLLAEDIALTVSVVAVEDRVTISVKNTGRDRTSDVSVKLELDTFVYREDLSKLLSPGSKREVTIRVKSPQRQGSFPLLTTVYYRNQGEILSVVDAGYFNWGREEVLPDTCELETIRMTSEKDVSLRFAEGRRQRLHLPEEIEQEKALIGKGSAVYQLRNSRSSFNTNYAIFSIIENDPSEQFQATKICSSRLVSTSVFSRKSIFPLPLLVAIVLLAFSATAAALRFFSGRGYSPLGVAIVRYLFSIFVVALLFVLFRSLHYLSDWLLPYFYNFAPENPVVEYFWIAGTSLLRWFYFQGIEYDNFFNYLAEPLFVYILTVNLAVIYYLVRPDPKDEKYWQLMLTIFSLPLLRLAVGQKQLAAAGKSSGAVHWNRGSRLAILSLMVKAFYLPILSSWTIGNIIRINSLTGSTIWTFASVNSYLVEALILLDVAIFAVGYLTELPQLKNRIRSVEPTLFGWFICLICYPPFNKFVFVPIDIPLHQHWTPSFGVVGSLALLATTLLWAIYVWASVALGFRASNLTNRGIVSSGPYRYIRHPAYVSKVLVWSIASFCLSTMNFYLVTTFLIIYTLRAWTEERHLSQDPDFLEYKKKVPWKICPGVW